MVAMEDEATSSPERSEHEAEGTLHRLASLKAQPGSHHHFSDAETVQLATFINARFKDEPLLASLLPVDGTNPDAFFDAWGDGRLLIVLVDAACEGAVDLAFLRRRARKPLGVSVRHLTIQHFAVLNDALEGCKNIEGLRLGFVGAEDFVQGNRPVILGVGWQLIRLVILQKVNIDERPELAGLFTAEEAVKHLGKPGQEELVLSRWFNQYLQAVGSDRQVWSFGVELADGVAWCALLNAIDPAACPPPDERDCEANASNAISAVHQMGVKGVFLTEEALMESDRKQNVMFCAQIMDAYPTIPSRLQHTHSRQSAAAAAAAAAISTTGGGGGGGAGMGSHKKNTGSISSSHHSKGSSSTAASSMCTATSSPGGRDVGSSSAPPPAPPGAMSPPKARWGFGRKDPLPAEAGEGKVYYDSDGEVESTAACGLGFFSCISRN